MLILNGIVAWFGTLAGRLALGGGLIASYFGWLAIHDHNIWNSAVADTNTKIEKVTNEKVSMAVNAGRKSSSGGTSSGVRKLIYRD